MKHKKPITQNINISYTDYDNGKIDVFIGGVKIGAINPKVFIGVKLNLN